MPTQATGAWPESGQRLPQSGVVGWERREISEETGLPHCTIPGGIYLIVIFPEWCTWGRWLKEMDECDDQLYVSRWLGYTLQLLTTPLGVSVKVFCESE